MITFQRESFKDLEEEIIPLWEQHYDEIASNKDVIKLDPNLGGYRAFDECGGLIILTLRDNGKLVGYSFFVLQMSLHYQTVIMAANDLFYVLPEYRGKMLGSKLMREAEKILKDLGVHQILMRTKSYANFGVLLERNGYEETEVHYRKLINTP